MKPNYKIVKILNMDGDLPAFFDGKKEVTLLRDSDFFQYKKKQKISRQDYATAISHIYGLKCIQKLDPDLWYHTRSIMYAALFSDKLLERLNEIIKEIKREDKDDSDPPMPWKANYASAETLTAESVIKELKEKNIL